MADQSLAEIYASKGDQTRWSLEAKITALRFVVEREELAYRHYSFSQYRLPVFRSTLVVLLGSSIFAFVLNSNNSEAQSQVTTASRLVLFVVLLCALILSRQLAWEKEPRSTGFVISHRITFTYFIVFGGMLCVFRYSKLDEYHHECLFPVAIAIHLSIIPIVTRMSLVYAKYLWVYLLANFSIQVALLAENPSEIGDYVLVFPFLVPVVLCLHYNIYRRDHQMRLLFRAVRALQSSKKKTQRLLESIVPSTVVPQLMMGKWPIVCHYSQPSTIVFIAICDFTSIVERMTPQAVVGLLNEVFVQFDRIVREAELFKVETIDNVYMFAGGIEDSHQKDHAEAAARAAVECQKAMDMFRKRGPDSEDIRIRVGLHSGSVLAGIIGIKLPRFRLFGDTINTAARMQSKATPGAILVSEDTATSIKDSICLRGPILKYMKGKGMQRVYEVSSSEYSRNVTEVDVLSSKPNGMRLSGEDPKAKLQWGVTKVVHARRVVNLGRTFDESMQAEHTPRRHRSMPDIRFQSPMSDPGELKAVPQAEESFRIRRMKRTTAIGALATQQHRRRQRRSTLTGMRDSFRQKRSSFSLRNLRQESISENNRGSFLSLSGSFRGRRSTGSRLSGVGFLASPMPATPQMQMLSEDELIPMSDNEPYATGYVDTTVPEEPILENGGEYESTAAAAAAGAEASNSSHSNRPSGCGSHRTSDSDLRSLRDSVSDPVTPRQSHGSRRSPVAGGSAARSPGTPPIHDSTTTCVSPSPSIRGQRNSAPYTKSSLPMRLRSASETPNRSSAGLPGALDSSPAPRRLSLSQWMAKGLGKSPEKKPRVRRRSSVPAEKKKSNLGHGHWRPLPSRNSSGSERKLDFWGIIDSTLEVDVRSRSNASSSRNSLAKTLLPQSKATRTVPVSPIREEQLTSLGELHEEIREALRNSGVGLDEADPNDPQAASAASDSASMPAIAIGPPHPGVVTTSTRDRKTSFSAEHPVPASEASVVPNAD
eukprot:Rmarinus@m.22452